jgi:hypothetical protein
MLEKFKYINHIGEVLEFGAGSLFANENELRDFSWSITSTNDKISGFNKGIVAKTIPLILKCESAEDGINLRNRIFEVFEKDILAHKHGRIIIGDYYLKCFVTDSSKSNYLINKGFLCLDVTVQTDFPEWIKETTTSFRPNSTEGENTFLDFAFDFPYDFANSLSTMTLNNTGFVASNFRMVIYGAVSSPTVFIGNHKYSVNVDIASGEYLTIDSVNKTIVLTKANGQQVNCFNNRDKDSYIFEKIPSGLNVASSTNEGISFDVTLLEERSEPKWT